VEKHLLVIKEDEGLLPAWAFSRVMRTRFWVAQDADGDAQEKGMPLTSTRGAWKG